MSNSRVQSVWNINPVTDPIESIPFVLSDTYLEELIMDAYHEAQSQHTCVYRETPDGYACAECIYS